MGKRKKDNYGDWEILSPLGEGGQAWTHHVRHQDGRVGVLKVIKNPKRGWRFDREVMALKRLQSPAVPKFLDSGELENRPWVVTENCGQPLLEVINQATLVCRLSWFRDIVLATRDAHQAEIVHRDIKPDNVVISIDKSGAYLIDFGICAISDSDPSHNTTLEAFGNPAFAAPECTLGHLEQSEKASDIYSLGKVLYWLMSDRKPIFREETSELEGTLLSIPANIEARVIDIIRACVKESPQNRIMAEELLIRVENLLVYTEKITQEENQGLYRIIDNFGNNGEFHPSGRSIVSPGFSTQDLHSSQVVAGLLENRIQAVRVENKANITLRIHRITIAIRCLSPVGQVYLSLVEDSEGVPSDRELGVYSLDLICRSAQQISAIECDIKIAPGRFWILLKPTDLPKTYASIHAATNGVSSHRSVFAESGDGGITWEAREGGPGIAVRIDASIDGVGC